MRGREGGREEGGKGREKDEAINTKIRLTIGQAHLHNTQPVFELTK